MFRLSEKALVVWKIKAASLVALFLLSVQGVKLDTLTDIFKNINALPSHPLDNLQSASGEHAICAKDEIEHLNDTV